MGRIYNEDIEQFFKNSLVQAVAAHDEVVASKILPVGQFYHLNEGI
jgi:hypothetical protein